MEKFTLDDIAGYEAEKRELEQIIAMFASYKEYAGRGAQLSRGLILSGEPGVGKTLFAKVLANETHAPFYYLQGSRLSSFFGTGRIARVFRKAHKHAPAVIFIDELNSFVGDDYYETDRTQRNLSAMLRLIDGIEGGEGVFVVGATSEKETLDPALLRPGRMDKHICLSAPDRASRAAILEKYLRGVDIDKSGVDINALAEKTRGMNGAGLKTLVNEAVLECLYACKPLTNAVFAVHIRKINGQDLARLSEVRDKRQIACHTVGHMLAARELFGVYDALGIAYSADADGNSAVRSLLQSGNNDDDEDDEEDDAPAALGDDKQKLLNKVAVALGGLAAEEVCLGRTYSDCKDDLLFAETLIHSGMRCGFFGFEFVNADNYYYMEISQSLLESRERLTAQTLQEQFARAKQIVAENAGAARLLTRELAARGALEPEEAEELLEKAGGE